MALSPTLVGALVGAGVIKPLQGGGPVPVNALVARGSGLPLFSRLNNELLIARTA